MGQRYWIGRKRAAMAMARGAASAEARLLHFELAGRCSIRAAQLSTAGTREAGGEGAVLHLSDTAWSGPVAAASPPDRGSEFLRAPGPGVGEAP